MSCAPKRLPRVRQRRMEATAGERRPVGACHLSGLTYISSHCSLATTHAFDVLGDPVRRRILELLADGEQSSGEVCAVVQEEFGISQPGVSQHLRVLRDNGFATVRAVGTRRLYSVDPAPCRRSTCGWSATGGSGPSDWTPLAPSWCAESGNAAPSMAAARPQSTSRTGRTTRAHDRHH